MQWFQRDLLRPVGVPLNGSAAGWVYRRGQPLIIQDAKVDKRHFKVVDRVTKHETHSLVAVPLMVHGEVVGVLEALNKKDDAHYTEEDLTILENSWRTGRTGHAKYGSSEKSKSCAHRTCGTGTPQNRLYRDHITRVSHSPGTDPWTCNIPAGTDR